jgi:histidine triad (HIT) family protein
MEDCVFCKIVAGKIPSHQIYEDGQFIVFLSIDPISAGHSLVVPREHYRWVWDVPDAGAYFEVARKIALATQKAFGIEAVHSRIVGEEVPHAHIWIYPDPGADNAKSGKDDLAANALKIRSSIRSD